MEEIYNTIVKRVNENYNIRIEHCTTNAISHSVEEDV